MHRRVGEVNMIDTLIDLLRERHAGGLRVSAVTVERGDQGWQARISYANWAASPELADTLPGHTVRVDTEQ